MDGAISYVSGSSELENLIDADSSPVIEGDLFIQQLSETLIFRYCPKKICLVI